MKKRSTPDIRERLGFAIKARREELGLTQEDLAHTSQIHRTYISDVERGSRNICLMNIERVASALAVRISELFQIAERR
jgi:transcriptional regulator with XRE-family HTH domain